MKKKMILMLTLLAGVLTANADNVISVSSADVMQGSTGVINIDLDNTDVIASFQFDVTLPDGFGFVLEEGDPVADVTDRTNTLGVNSSVSGQTATFLVAGTSKTSQVYGNTGTILKVKVTSDGTQEIGAKFDASLGHIVLSKEGAIKQELADVSFKVTVIENRIVLDEESITAPEAAAGVDVKVKRTINANEWSTICLPFEMSEAQVKAAFGDDVLLKDFNGYDTKEEGEVIVGFIVNFNTVTAIEANHPYLIKVSSKITEFDVDGVDIDPAEDDAYIEFDNGKSGSKRVVFSGFYGTYHANTEVEEEALFLNANKFYYSKGLTKMKAFRAYFVFLDVLPDMEASARSIEINIDGTTSINNAIRELPNDGKYYNLKGQRVEKPSKGVYILNGKKVVVK